MLTISCGEAALIRCQTLVWLQLVVLTISLRLWDPSHPQESLQVAGGNINTHLRAGIQGTPNLPRLSLHTVFSAHPSPPASSRTVKAQNKPRFLRGARRAGCSDRKQVPDNSKHAGFMRRRPGGRRRSQRTTKETQSPPLDTHCPPLTEELGMDESEWTAGTQRTPFLVIPR